MVDKDWFIRAIAPDDDGDAGSTAKLHQPIKWSPNGPALTGDSFGNSQYAPGSCQMT